MYQESQGQEAEGYYGDGGYYDEYNESPPPEPAVKKSIAESIDLRAAIAPALAVGIAVAIVRSGKLPEGMQTSAERLFESDLAAIFVTTAYAHYLINYENSHIDPQERYYDAMFRTGTLVLALAAGRSLI